MPNRFPRWTPRAAWPSSPSRCWSPTRCCALAFSTWKSSSAALVYGGLTAILAGLYAAVVGALGTALGTTGSALLAGALVAGAANPLRGRLQRTVNRRLYGHADEPYVALLRLGDRLGGTPAPGEALRTVVDAVADALRLPYVAIEVLGAGGAAPAASTGRVQHGERHRVTLRADGEVVGHLVVAPRAPGEPLRAADRRLLEDLAGPVGPAVHAARLADEVQRSRKQLVTAREEERRRMRRDLHDGLGPTLAALALRLDTAAGRVERDPAGVQEELLALRNATEDAITEVRRLVYALRPPALDELGLLPALREHAARLGGTGLAVAVRAPDSIPALPAAVEVAAYRITLEALTNVTRHAAARTCTVSLSVNGALEMRVEDDGRGLPEDLRAGIGLASMRERAAELGGAVRVGPRGRGLPGTRVSARLPLPE